jgi:hypothetical protein
MSKIISFLAMLLTSHIGYSQFIDKSYGNFHQDYGESISIFDNSAIYISGTSTSVNNIKNFDGFGLLINENLDSLLFAYFEDTAQYNNTFKGCTYNQKLYAAGFTSTSCCDTAYDLDGTLYKMDTQGSYTHVQFGGNYYDQPIDVTAIGKYLYVAGWTQSYTYEPFGPDAYDGYLVKLDTNLNVVWEKHYGSDTVDQFIAIIKTDDNNLLMGGETYNVSALDYKNAYLVKADTAGNIIWEKSYSFYNNYKEVIVSIYECENHDILISGTASKKNSNYVVPMLMRLDSNGVLIWKKTMYDIAQSINTPFNKRWYDGDIESAVEIPGGDIIFCGSWFDQDSTTNYGFVCRYTANGDSIWRRDFVQPFYDIYLKDLLVVQDTIYACGAYVSLSANGFVDAYIIKMDINGCFLDSCLISSVAIAKPKQEAQRILYPNPANEIINLKITQPQEVLNISIINSLGQIVTSTQVIKELNTFNTQDLCSGIYTLQVRRKEEIENLKFVINH